MNVKLRKSLNRIKKGTARPEDRVRAERDVVRQLRRQAIGPKFPELRVRKVKKASHPTWPKSKDQHGQGRPMLVDRPIRAIISEKNETIKAETRVMLSLLPKWMLDQVALTRFDYSSANNLLNKIRTHIRVR